MKHVIGVDFGTDSVRAMIVNATNGASVASAVSHYSRWKQGKYCDPDVNQFRQHPLDYIECLESSITEALSQCPSGTAASVMGIAIDTTGSTPVAVDRSGTPLAMQSAFAENPNAMFILWKDHTGIQEAQEINEHSRRAEVDYTKFAGGIYSSEWFWSKILHTLRHDGGIREAAYSWVEHCDWIPFLLSGGNDVHKMKRSRCAAGHKALWHPDFAGLPPNEFLAGIDPLLDGVRDRLYSDTFTSDEVAGHLSAEWSGKLGLSQEVVIAVGAFDAHMGAVGGEIAPYYLSKVMGTSTCDILVAPSTELEDKLVKGICGQVDGSVLPGMMGLEAGQSAFGDVYAWFAKLLDWSLTELVGKSDLIHSDLKQQILADSRSNIMLHLTEQAEQIDPLKSGIMALDWLNGRRTPDANQALKGAIFGLNLGSDAPKIFRALVESTCYGARQIVERFEEEGIPIKGIIGLGGVAKKSPFVMQIMADVLNRPIKIARSEQTCALGAAMFAATAAGQYNRVEDAMQKMGAGFDVVYEPRPAEASKYEDLYQSYRRLGSLVEKETDGD